MTAETLTPPASRPPSPQPAPRTSSPVADPSTVPPEGLLYPHRFTVADYMAMSEQGIIRRRNELIAGEIFDMSGQGNAHAVAVTNGFVELVRVFPKPWFVRCRSTHRFGEHDAPEPDLALLRQPPVEGALVDELPLLVVEVSDATLGLDLGRKRLGYARFGVPEYWVVDLGRRQVNVFRGPRRDAATPEDAYAEHAIVQKEGVLAPPAAPGATIRVADVVPTAGA